MSNAARADAVVGTVHRTVFANEDNGWCVIKLRRDDGLPFTAVGTLLGVRHGDRLRLTGTWVRHERFGEQLKVESFVPIHPSTRRGILGFLASGRIRGVGPAIAERLVDHFGLQTLEVIDKEPHRLIEVDGIGRVKAEQIRTSWADHRGIYPIMVFLQSQGVSPALAVKIHKRYGASAVEKVRENPYQLAADVSGIGFLTADRIARNLDIALDDPARLQAGLEHVLRQASGEGHVYQPRERLLREGAALLHVDRELLEEPLERLAETVRVVVDGADDGAVYLPVLYAAERTVAADLPALAEETPELTVDVQTAVSWFEGRAHIQLASRQREAVAAALTHPVSVVTGGPGTGKTTLVRALTTILAAKDGTVLLAAPTGRAAKRLSEATGLPARTVHRLLEYQPADAAFARNRQRPLESDMIVVDEASMLDVELTAFLLEAVPPGCRVVLVGDADQLPSVGPGQVLADIIASETVPVVRLSHIFRQEHESLIVLNAHRINNGSMPRVHTDELTDFYLVERADPTSARTTVLELVAERIPDRFGLDPVDDVQVLTPMHRGELGVKALNEELQQALNPGGDELDLGARRFRAGDKVMQIRNNYDLGVFNGDIGRVAAADEEQDALLVRFDNRLVAVPQDSLDELTPAYACTIHKAQGSEYPAVVIALHDQHWIMLRRNLIYTAVTRGRRLVVIVGTRRALAQAVRNASQRERHTRLAHLLRRPTELPPTVPVPV